MLTIITVILELIIAVIILVIVILGNKNCIEVKTAKRLMDDGLMWCKYKGEYIWINHDDFVKFFLTDRSE
jgi:hypothetical protein